MKKQLEAFKAETAATKRAHAKVVAEAGQAKGMLRAHNDLVMSSKLREVEIEKVNSQP